MGTAFRFKVENQGMDLLAGEKDDRFITPQDLSDSELPLGMRTNIIVKAIAYEYEGEEIPAEVFSEEGGEAAGILFADLMDWGGCSDDEVYDLMNPLGMEEYEMTECLLLRREKGVAPFEKKSDRDRFLFGRKAYVKERYRRKGVFTKMQQALLLYAETMFHYGSDIICFAATPLTESHDGLYYGMPSLVPEMDQKKADDLVKLFEKMGASRLSNSSEMDRMRIPILYYKIPPFLDAT